MVRKVRFRLIRWLAGRDHIAVNLRLGENDAWLYVPPGSVLLSHNCTFTGGDRGLTVVRVGTAPASISGGRG